jgi:exopolysaccharide production protein ExoY
MERLTATSPSRSEQYLTRKVTRSMSTSIVHEPSLSYCILKRFTDIVLSAVGILILMPVFLVIMACIKLDDGGKVLYLREIIGQHGRRFYALKFRTMIPNADEYLAKHPELMRKYQQNMKLEGDPRITRFGKFLRRTSLDELPQLFNVLVGQMSLVGPRMIHPSELPRYGKWAQKRLSVKPGITGPWQIYGRGHTSYQERIMFDMRYIDTCSYKKDLSLLFKTFKVFVIHTGA